MERPEIQRLFEEAQAGKRQALEKLLERHRPLVASVVSRYAERWEDRQDLIQDVMEAATANFVQVREGMAFPKWMMSIADNLGKNWRSRKLPKQRATDSLDSPLYQERGSAQPIEENSCLEDKVMLTETMKYLADVLEQSCSGIEYNVMIRKWNGREYTQIADELGIKVPTARSHYHRGERKLWTCLLAEHRDFLGGETVITGAIAKAALAADPETRLTDEEKQACKAGDKSRKAFASGCMKVRQFLPLSACILLFWSVSHG